MTHPIAPNRISRRQAFAFAAVLPLATAHPARAQSTISGTYNAQGRNADGSAYSGIVTISQQGDQVAFGWQIGGQSYVGNGYRNGDVVSVDWGDAHPVIYVVMPDGELHGTWADGTALEKLSP